MPKKWIGEERRLWDHILNFVVLPKKWLLQIKQEFCMGTNEKSTLASKELVTIHLILLDAWGTALNICSHWIETPRKAVLLVNTDCPLVKIVRSNSGGHF